MEQDRDLNRSGQQVEPQLNRPEQASKSAALPTAGGEGPNKSSARQPAAAVNKPTHSLLAKTVAIILFIVFAVTGIFGLCGGFIAYVDGQNGKTQPYGSSLFNEVIYDYNHLAISSYRQVAEDGNGAVSQEKVNQQLIEHIGETNYRYEIMDVEGRVLASNIAGQTVHKAGWEHSSGIQGGQVLNVQGYITERLTAQDNIATIYELANALYEGQGLYLTAGAVFIVLALIVFIFLMCAAGRHKDSPEPRRSFIDLIPFDLLFGLCLAAGTALALGIVEMGQRISSMWPLQLGVIALLLAGGLLVGLLLCMSFATRVKTHTFWRNNVCAYVIIYCFRGIRGVWRFIKGIFIDLPILWKGIVAFCAGGLVMLIAFVSANAGAGFVTMLCLAAIVAMFVMMIRLLKQANRIQKGGEALAKGDMSQPIETKGMAKDLKHHAENLNNIAAGMNNAINERMKSERMKTDLITNVSHDLKTPLTNIVSYVDLLKKEELHNDIAKGYVEVLDRQAARLKKLTEDLVEASKASSGMIKVQPVPTNLREILDQSLAEYGDRLTAAGLTPVLNKIDRPIMVLADGRLMWRVFDNLLNNIVKYGLPGTRVYINVEQRESVAEVVFKNISKEPLNIPVSELTERFVRGDASRNTDGSGLGLSIAKSLAELQNAGFVLAINGDLFCASVQIPLARGTNGEIPGYALPKESLVQTNSGGEAIMDIQTQQDSQPYATNLLTQSEKTEESIEAAKERVDNNEK